MINEKWEEKGGNLREIGDMGHWNQNHSSTQSLKIHKNPILWLKPFSFLINFNKYIFHCLIP